MSGGSAARLRVEQLARGGAFPLVSTRSVSVRGGAARVRLALRSNPAGVGSPSHGLSVGGVFDWRMARCVGGHYAQDGWVGFSRGQAFASYTRWQAAVSMPLRCTLLHAMLQHEA